MTYLGKQVSYRKGTGKLFRLWYNQLFGIFSFCKYTETSDCEFFKYTICRKFFYQKFKNRELKKWVVIQSYQLYCIFFPPMIPKLMEFSFCHISKMSIYSIYKPLIVYRCRILSEFTSRACMHRHDFLPSREH